MAIRVFWHNPQQTIIRLEFEGHWGWQEFRPAWAKLQAMMARTPHPVDCLIDMRYSAALPAGALNVAVRTAREAALNTGQIVFIGASRVVENLIDMLVSVYPPAKHYMIHFIETVEDASELLAQSRRDISPRSPAGRGTQLGSPPAD